MSAKKSLFILLLIVVISGVCGTAEAKSVHAITSHPDNKLKKHEIQSNQLEYQTEINVTNYGAGVPTIFGVGSA